MQDSPSQRLSVESYRDLCELISTRHDFASGVEMKVSYIPSWKLDYVPLPCWLMSHCKWSRAQGDRFSILFLVKGFHPHIPNEGDWMVGNYNYLRVTVSSMFGLSSTVLETLICHGVFPVSWSEDLGMSGFLCDPHLSCFYFLLYNVF